MTPLRNIDLNLLLVLRTILAERSLTRAGQRLGMTQPAVSNALKRLRLILRDELMVRGADGMQPTSRSRELQPMLEDWFASMEQAIWPQRFDPGSAQRRFRLAFSDEAAVIIVPQLSARIAQKAPGFSLRIEPKALLSTSTQITRRQIDLAIGLFDELPTQIDQQMLFEERHVCLMRSGHPLAAGEMTLGRLVEHGHVRLRSGVSASANLDLLLRQAGLKRHTAVSLNQVLGVPQTLLRTDFICCMLERLADAVSDGNDDIIKRALPLPTTSVKLIWHKTSGTDEALSWLREEIVDVCNKLATPGHR